jgi:hypothetical protein
VDDKRYHILLRNNTQNQIFGSFDKKDPKSSGGFLEDQKSFPFNTSFNAVDSLVPSFLALPPPRAPPADNLIGDDDDKHDNGAAA